MLSYLHSVMVRIRTVHRSIMLVQIPMEFHDCIKVAPLVIDELGAWRAQRTPTRSRPCIDIEKWGDKVDWHAPVTSVEMKAMLNWNLRTVTHPDSLWSFTGIFCVEWNSYLELRAALLAMRKRGISDDKMSVLVTHGEGDPYDTDEHAHRSARSSVAGSRRPRIALRSTPASPITKRSITRSSRVSSRTFDAPSKRRPELAPAVPARNEQDGLSNTVVTNVDRADEDRPGQLQLVVFGNGTFATHPLPDGGVLTIGRGTNCDVAIDDESISRRHAILKVGKPLTIEDLGSANGTLVRNAKLKLGRPITISVGELVGLGKASMILQLRSRPVRRRTVWTHDYFEARLEEECAHEQRSGLAFAVLHIQADPRAGAGFVEDTVGELVRESDVLGKYGPHKYEVLLPATSPPDANEAVKRLEAQLAERGLKWDVTMTCCPRDGRSPYQLASRMPVGLAQERSSSEIIVTDPQMLSLYRMIDLVAQSHIGVLLLGETGVGKEVFARAVHNRSPRATGPFVEINCAALTESLLESELFGHEKGAFTNATSAKPGLIESADGGTLFLDEIGEMPLGTQAKLLRVLEDSQLRRVGAIKQLTIDVRFVAATNSDLEARVANGDFRRDLYFRLNGVSLVIPPLRERLAELEPIAQAFIRRNTRRDTRLSAAALELMRNYDWPGNVRELKNMMERAVLLSGGEVIGPEHLPAEKMRVTKVTGGSAWPPSEPAPRRGSVDEQQILQALERTGGNQTTAARLLGISRRTLVNRLNEYEQVHRPRKNKLKKK